MQIHHYELFVYMFKICTAESGYLEDSFLAYLYASIFRRIVHYHNLQNFMAEVLIILNIKAIRFKMLVFAFSRHEKFNIWRLHLNKNLILRIYTHPAVDIICHPDPQN